MKLLKNIKVFRYVNCEKKIKRNNFRELENDRKTQIIAKIIKILRYIIYVN